MPLGLDRKTTSVDVMFKEDALKKEEFENKFKVDVVVYPN